MEECDSRNNKVDSNMRCTLPSGHAGRHVGRGETWEVVDFPNAMTLGEIETFPIDLWMAIPGSSRERLLAKAHEARSA